MRLLKQIPLLLTSVALAASAPASAQFYQGKTVTMMINYGIGGNTDIEGRVFMRYLPRHFAPGFRR